MSLQQKCDLTVGALLPQLSKSIPEDSVTRAADRSLQLLDVDPIGLDHMDRKYLSTIATSFGGGPVGIETMAAALSEPRDAIEEIIEPYLIQKGFVQRTPRGRLLTPHAFRHLGHLWCIAQFCWYLLCSAPYTDGAVR